MNKLIAAFLGLTLSLPSVAGSYPFCLKISDTTNEVFCEVTQVIARSASGFDVNSMSSWACTKDFTELKKQNFSNSPAGSDYVSFGGPLTMVDYATLNFQASGPQSLFSSLVDISGLVQGSSSITMFFLENEIVFNPTFVITKNNTIFVEFLAYGGCFEKN